MLQQCLPFTVLKRLLFKVLFLRTIFVATAPTVYGIETTPCLQLLLFHLLVATVLTVYGIETSFYFLAFAERIVFSVATVLTVYGIET